MRVLLIDNYDSFTFNLVQLVRELGAQVDVVRNDRTTVEAALAAGATHLVVSPGPGRPEDAGVTLPLVRAALGRLPLLGVCLGHQALALTCGGAIGRVAPMHGKTSELTHDGRGVFSGQPPRLTVGRYHSLAVVEPGALVQREAAGGAGASSGGCKATEAERAASPTAPLLTPKRPSAAPSLSGSSRRKAGFKFTAAALGL